jgi:glyoxylase-like metal-dependent hydrolase (beta-lactamase superfamily II)
VARLLDGGVADDRVVGAGRWIPPEEAPFMAPAEVPPMDPGDPGVLPSPEPDTVRVSENTFLLVSPFYTEVATLQRDTVWILDATIGENRARQDHEWVRRLFGDDRPLAVVVTDLAWPHVAGLRYWVAHGATVVSHPASEPFLRSVVEREWTLRPDALESRRARAPFRFRPVEGERLDLAGGAIRVLPIGGIGSETAVMVWLPEAGFLWAGDYVQDSDAPTTYAREVWRAARRAGIAPDRFAAQHHPLSEWEKLEALFGGE